MNAQLEVREILVPTDFSTEAEPALAHARDLGTRFGARLTLFHAIEVPDHRFAHWAFAHAHQVWDRAELEARHALEARAACLKPAGRVVVEKACSVHRALVAFIRATTPDLVVMATHGRTGVEHLLLGSVTEQVVRQVYRPVLCVPTRDEAPTLPYRRIAVPTDFSLSSRLAFPIAAAFARVFESELLGIHVTPHASLATMSGIPDPAPVVVPTEASLARFLKADFDGLPVTAQVYQGNPWERIVQAARLQKADLIVMSTKGQDSLADKILGSNTDRVIRHSTCPVLVV